MQCLPTAHAGLVITPLVASDAGEHFALIDANRSHLAPWLPWVEGTRSERDVASFIAVAIAGWQGRQQLACALRLHEKIIGGIGIVEWDNANATTSLGYWLDAQHSGHGYMTHAVAALTQHCFHALGSHRVQIRAAVENTASRSIPERLGFTLEGIARGAARLASGHHDLATYSLLSHEPVQLSPQP